MRRGAGLVLIILATVLVATPPPAVADTTVPLAITGFRDLVVDEPHGHLFISQGTAQVLVTDLAGVPVTSIDQMAGASGMTMSPDGSTVFVALAQADAVAAIDTATLAVDRWDTGADSCPTHLAPAEGLVWFSSCESFGRLGALDPATGHVTRQLGDALLDSPVLASSPALPGRLLALDRNSSPGELVSFAVSGGATPDATVLASTRKVGSNCKDLAVTPDGGRVVTACGAPYQHNVFDVDDLAPAGSYAASTYPDAVAVRADGMVAGGISGWYQPDVYLYRDGSTSLLRSVEFGGTANELYSGGLAFGAQNLYAVTGDQYSMDNFRLQVVTPAVPSLVVTTDRRRYTIGDTAHVTVELHADGTDRAVTLAAVTSTSDTPVGAADLAEGEHLVADVEITARTTFVARYEGDPDAGPVVINRTVEADRKASGLELGTDKTQYLYGDTAHLSVTLGSGSADRHVRVIADTGSTVGPVGEGDVPVGGTLDLDVEMTAPTTFTAIYSGDDTWAPERVATSVGVDLRPASLAVHLDRRRYVSGDTADVSVDLDTSSPDREVVVRRSTPHGTVVVARGDVPPGETWHAPVPLRVSSTIIVAYAGDEGTEARVVHRDVAVHALLAGVVEGEDARRGRYHVYDAGARVRFLSTLQPARPGGCVDVRLQFAVAGIFRDDDVRRCLPVDRLGVTRTSVRSVPSAAGRAFRIRAEWRGDAVVGSARSTWVYVRFR